ncbi:hypothetical protein [Novosphingobium album (ex Hu et al. 2023)]|uniref:Uncharacterized protein n=1 Tax=Novosphingobium album (ex Hu et al. 2023) TaxID=2930093 RepID=A0ABT0B3R0_9SPHN|nr:hypothetical protein [Novosphingobium album (ex Hu et al. 2023)]MCJ2179529.1 hypothetical protein [Novosphingobium album (ex Hu et al. 2023)]
MAFSLDFCEARAREAAEAGSNAVLDNVRDRELRSEAAWRSMADQLEQVEKNRRQREDEKAAQEQ